jgi:hypothetical protein
MTRSITTGKGEMDVLKNEVVQLASADVAGKGRIRLF